MRARPPLRAPLSPSLVRFHQPESHLIPGEPCTGGGGGRPLRRPDSGRKSAETAGEKPAAAKGCADARSRQPCAGVFVGLWMRLIRRPGVHGGAAACLLRCVTRSYVPACLLMDWRRPNLSDLLAAIWGPGECMLCPYAIVVGVGVYLNLPPS